MISFYSFILLVCGLFIAGIIKYKGIKGVDEKSLFHLFNLDRSQYKEYIRQGIVPTKLKEAFNENNELNYKQDYVLEISKGYGEWWITVGGVKEYLIKDLINDNCKKLEVYKFSGNLLNYRQWDAYAWWGFFSLTLSGLLIPIIAYTLPLFPTWFINLFSWLPTMSNPITHKVILGISFILFLSYSNLIMVSNIGEEGNITLESSWQFFAFGLWISVSSIFYRFLDSKSKDKRLKPSGKPSLLPFIVFGLIFFLGFYYIGTPTILIISGLISILPQSFGNSVIRLNTTESSLRI